MTRHMSRCGIWFILTSLIVGCNDLEDRKDSDVTARRIPNKVGVTVYRDKETNRPHTGRRFTLEESDTIRVLWRYICERSDSRFAARAEWTTEAAVGTVFDDDQTSYIYLDSSNSRWRDNEGNGGYMPDDFAEFFEKLIADNLPRKEEKEEKVGGEKAG